jgi:hypothetical protein
MISFRPKVSGTYYASVYSPTGEGWIELKTNDAQRQITTTTRNMTSQFVRDTELRLGQSIPISLPGTPAEYRQGVFKRSGEEHFWRFQYQPSRRMRDSSGGWSERKGSWEENYQTLAYTLDASYIVSVLHNSTDASAINVTLYAGNPGDPTGPPLQITAPDVIRTGPVLIPNVGYRTDWSISEKKLQEWVGNNNRLSPGQNLYLAVKWTGLPTNPNSAVFSRGYSIWVETRNKPSSYGILENDSSTFNPIIVDRWCATETYGREQTMQLIERTGEMFSLNERLAPDDADYVVVWLAEGEHLNVTYRGGIPAALDVGGPMQATDADATGLMHTSASELDFIWEGIPDQWPYITADKRQGHLVYKLHPDFPAGEFIQDYRPFTPASDVPLACPPEYAWIRDVDAGCDGQYFAERGFLWSYHHDTNGLEVSTDNEVHLTMTAFVTGPYMIRVRGQDALPGGPGLWATYKGFGVGVPYTLNLNLGVIPNPPRPHWQFLDAGADPSRQLMCGR